MNISIPLIVLFALFSCSPIKTIAQSDSSYIRAISENLSGFYVKSLNTEAPVYTGKIYYKYPFKISNNGHSYFLESKFSKGNIFYDGKFYPDVSLLYDILQDQLILLYHDNYSSIIPLKEKVARFSFLDREFINVNSENPSLMPNGYYESLYKSNNVNLLAKRSKAIKKTVESGAIQYSVISADDYFLLKDGSINKVNKKRAFLKLLKRTGNQQYLKDNNLNFRRDKERWIIALAKYYDTKNSK
jgi:hypothetical protein